MLEVSPSLVSTLEGDREVDASLGGSNRRSLEGSLYILGRRRLVQLPEWGAENLMKLPRAYQTRETREPVSFGPN